MTNQFFNLDLKREIQNFDKRQHSISTGFDENLEQPYIIDIADMGYFYLKEFERDKDYQTLKNLGFRNEGDEKPKEYIIDFDELINDYTRADYEYFMSKDGLGPQEYKESDFNKWVEDVFCPQLMGETLNQMHLKEHMSKIFNYLEENEKAHWQEMGRPANHIYNSVRKFKHRHAR